MSMLRLVIQTPIATKTVEVNAYLHVGAFLSSFVSALGLPPIDVFGSPLAYALHIGGGTTLPPSESFASLGLVNGTQLILASNTSAAPTIPIVHPSIRKPDPMPNTPVGKVWRRRSFLIWGGSLFTFAASGLGAGAATAFIQGITSIPNIMAQGGPMSSTTNPSGAKANFTFTQHQQTVRTLSWSRNGLIASGGDDAMVLLWGTDGTVFQQFPHQAAVRALAWSPEGERLVIGAGNQVTFWQANTGTLLARSLDQHAAPVTSLAWSTHAPLYIVSGSEDTKAIIWKSSNYLVQATFTRHTSAIESVSFASDGQTVATVPLGGIVRTWDAATAQETHGYLFDGNMPLHSLSFAPVGTQLLTGGEDGKLRLWDNALTCQTQEAGDFGIQCVVKPHILQFHTQPVRAVAWSPSGRFAASAGDDGIVALWAPGQNLSPLFTMQSPGPVKALAWGPSDTQIASASGNIVTLWQIH